MGHLARWRSWDESVGIHTKLQSYLLLRVVVLNGEDSVWQSHDRLEIGLKIKAADGVVFDPWFVLRLC